MSSSHESLGGYESQYRAVDDKEKRTEIVSIDVGSTSDVSETTILNDNPFVDPKIAEHYRQVYEESQYECRHEFDPLFEWTPQEEKKLVRKLDFRVALTSCILFVALQVDRGNINQAVSDNMLADLGLTTDDYNLGNTLFLVAFLAAEVPMALLSKRVGPDRFIPLQIICFSIVSFSQFWLVDKAGFLITRVLIGFIEGSLIADLVVWLSYFYKSKELPIRLSWFWTTLSLVQIFTALLAFAILRLRGHGDKAGWRWLFLIEGLFTLVIGIAAFYLMVPSAVQTKNWMHPKGWFDDREIKIVVNRVLRDDPSKGDMNNRQAVNWEGLRKSLVDYDMWPIYIIGLVTYTSSLTTTPYLTLVLKQVNFSKFNVNLLTIPSNVLHIIVLLIITWVSERINERSLFALIVPLWNLPILAALTWWSGTNVSVWGTWILYTLLLGQPYIHAICVGWCSRNSNSIRSRSLSAAVYNIFVQLGNVYANNIYRADDAPIYRRGNRTLFILTLMLIPIYISIKFYYVWRNKSKEAIWSKMSSSERAQYLKDNRGIGNKSLDFRFSH